MRVALRLLLAAVGAACALAAALAPGGALPGGAARVAAAPAAQHQEFVWDFTECFDRSVRTEGTDFVDAERLNLSGGCHLRFLQPGESWLEMPFALAEEPRSAATQGGTWSISMLHLAIRPDGPAPGLAPARVTLNGEEVWREPIPEGRYGPLNLWAASQVDVTGALRRGPNILRYEFLGGGATHYWLKLLRLGWDPR
jgi:hypothetical protein